MADAGNPESTWKALEREAPRTYHHVCLLDPTGQTDFTSGDNAYDCNKWDPMTVNELVQLDHRRKQYADRKKPEEQHAEP